MSAKTNRLKNRLRMATQIAHRTYSRFVDASNEQKRLQERVGKLESRLGRLAQVRDDRSDQDYVAISFRVSKAELKFAKHEENTQDFVAMMVRETCEKLLGEA